MHIADFIILFLIIVLFLLGIRRFHKTRKSGCCGGCETIKKIKPKDSHPSHYSYECCFKIEDMVCENCATKLTNLFNTQDKLAKADLSNKTLRVYSKVPPNHEEYMKLIRQLGYTVTEL